ncbi:hypothetical protein EJ08DRAFT_663606 [Tothia fuscella]|uniref:Uncharacterized protein n=1 Tax=Tothia fuscella TaxID=1048955 RepID=A0A9P4TW07_9PEZI|nr:hypothetical protein EJ08DRAFT_663606 [Tothia fuscella]
MPSSKTFKSCSMINFNDFSSSADALIRFFFTVTTNRRILKKKPHLYLNFLVCVSAVASIVSAQANTTAGGSPDSFRGGMMINRGGAMPNMNMMGRGGIPAAATPMMNMVRGGMIGAGTMGAAMPGMMGAGMPNMGMMGGMPNMMVRMMGANVV